MISIFLRRFPFIIPLATALLATLTVHTTFFQQEPHLLAIAVCADLLLTSPILYFLLIRKTSIPNITVLSVFALGLILACFLLPVEQQWLPNLIYTYVLPLIELGLVGWILFQVYHMRRAFEQADQGDFYSALQTASRSVFPERLARFLAAEVAAVYYSLFCWQRTVLKAGAFTYHKKSGTGLIIGTLVGIILVETFAVHLLLERWNPVVAWVATGLSLYGVLQLIAMARSAAQRPIQLLASQQLLQLRFGFFTETAIPLGSIDRIEATSRTPMNDGETISLSPLGAFSSHNLIIHLKTHAHMTSLYGTTKPFMSITLWIDDRDRFLQELEESTAC